MAKAIEWAAAVDGDFADGPDWVGGVAPGKTEIANLESFGGSPYAVTFDTQGHGNGHETPYAIRGLDIGVGVALDMVDNLQVGTAGRDGLKGGQVTNDGTIGVEDYSALDFSSTFTNNALVELSGEGAIHGNDRGGLVTTFINNGNIVFADMPGDGGLGVISTFDNEGNVSGTGSVVAKSNFVNNGTITGGPVNGPDGGMILRLMSGSAILNDNLIEVAAGNEISVLSPVIGSGEILINDGVFQAESAGDGGTFSADVTFGTSGSSLFVLADAGYGAMTYTGTILGFSKNGNSAIDLQDIVGSGAAEISYRGTKRGGVLKITGDGHSDTIAFNGDYLGVTFSADMTSTGTMVTAGKSGSLEIFVASTQTPSVAHFAGAMGAMTGHGVAGGLIDIRTVADSRQMMLTAPRLAIA